MNTRRKTVIMADSCIYVYEKLVNEKSAVTVETVPDGPILPTEHVIQHLLDNGTVLNRRKPTEGYFRSKNPVRTREKRKDPEYRRKKDEPQKVHRREERARAKKDKLVLIPNRSIISENPREVSNWTQTDLCAKKSKQHK